MGNPPLQIIAQFVRGAARHDRGNRNATPNETGAVSSHSDYGRCPTFPHCKLRATVTGSIFVILYLIGTQSIRPDLLFHL